MMADTSSSFDDGGRRAHEEPERDVPPPSLPPSSSSSLAENNDGIDGGGCDDDGSEGSDDVYLSEPEERPPPPPHSSPRRSLPSYDYKDDDGDADDDLDDEDDEDRDLVSITGSHAAPHHHPSSVAPSHAPTLTKSVTSAVSTLGEGVRHAVAHWRVLLFGQFLSFLLAGTGAASATLHFECRLSAPAFQSLFVYLGLALHGLTMLRRSLCGGGGTRTRGRGQLRKRGRVGRWVTRKMDGLDDEAAATAGSSPLHPSRLVRDRMIGDDDEEEDYGYDDDDDDDAVRDAINRRKPSVDAAADDAARAVAEVVGRDDESVNSDAAADAANAAVVPPGHSCLCGLVPLNAPPWAYFLLSFLDVEANYLTYLAFRYTTFASISLFDALAIPSAMVFSRALLAREYRPAHLTGAAICMIGVVVNVYSDYKEEQRIDAESEGGAGGGVGEEEEDRYPYRVWGDLLAITGGILYGLNDVLAELAVRNWGGREEFLSMLGVFGTFVSLVQVLAMETEDVSKFFNSNTASAEHLAEISRTFDDDTVGDDVERTIANEEEALGHRHCSTSSSVFLLSAYVLANYLAYTGTAKFLSVSEAALLNLSLLTGDLWAVLFSVVAERIFPLPLFYVALVLIVSGVVVYEIGPSPISEDNADAHQGKEIRIRNHRRRVLGRFRRRRKNNTIDPSYPDQDDPGLRWGYDHDEEDSLAGEGKGGFGDPEEDLELTEHASGGGRGGGRSRSHNGRVIRPKGLGFV